MEFQASVKKFYVTIKEELFVLSGKSVCAIFLTLYFSVYRAEELETALMEMVKQDNRRQLSARVNKRLDAQLN